jgi:uncharacterized protein YjbI with pentapeptide repeats
MTATDEQTARSRAPRGGVTAVLALLFTAAVLLVAALALPSPADAAIPSCQPGSGAKLAGKFVTTAALGQVATLQCADLRDANLTGADLTQVDLAGALATGANFSNVHMGQADLSGAKLAGANLSGADLSQATLTGADFSSANLAHAKLIQAEADDTTWTGADLTSVDATQAELKNATFDHAKVSSADFTQADLAGASFASARGLTPWSLYVGIAAGAVFLLLAALSLRKALGRRGRTPAAKAAPAEPGVVQGTYVGDTYQSIWNRPAGSTVQVAPTATPSATGAFNPINPPASSKRGFAMTFAVGLLGALIVAFGLHLFLGGMVGSFSFAFDTLATTTCSGPQCAVGVASGTVGLVGGVFVVIAGIFVRARA